ncbi:MAG: hypothetical protein FJZ09_05875 [Candidatus Omnitrophica bacterium]|nr:hypothetical protein [Candidatus Omnitrophota bacterium]
MVVRAGLKAAFGPILLSTIILSCGCAKKAVYQPLPPPPPPLKLEVLPPKPYRDAMWIAGHWAWKGPRRGYVWVPGRWKRR